MLGTLRKGQGRLTFVLPGGPGFPVDYLVQACDALEKNCDLVYIDYPGCGRSSVADAPVDFESVIDGVADTIAEIAGDVQFNVIAHSFGSIVLGELLKRNRVDNVLGCALVCPTPHDMSGALAAQSLLIARMNETDQHYVGAILSGDARADGAFMRRMMRYYCGRNDSLPAVDIPFDSDVYISVLRSAPPFDHARMFDSHKNTLYIFGTTDFITRDLFTLGDDRYVILPGGHFVFFDSPTLFANTLTSYFRRLES